MVYDFSQKGLTLYEAELMYQQAQETFNNALGLVAFRSLSGGGCKLQPNKSQVASVKVSQPASNNITSGKSNSTKVTTQNNTNTNKNTQPNNNSNRNQYLDKPTAGDNLGSSLRSQGKGKVDDFAKEPFLPDEAYGKNLPKFVEPGTKSLNKYDEFGNLKQTKYYDNYGREKGWVDFTNHGYPSNHSVPHWHEVQWNERYPIGGYKIDHRMDTNIPFK